MTTQLLEEEKSKENFRSWCKDKGYKILREYLSHENKKEKTTADFIILINGEEKKISLKTEGGLFTELNGGTGTRALSQWNSKKEDKNLLSIASKKYNTIKKSFPKSIRWEQVKNEPEVRQKILSIFRDVWFDILSQKENFYSFMDYLSKRKSDYVWVNGKLILTERKKDIIFSIEKYKSNSIVLGGYFKLRFKSSGGKLHSSIKMNGEPWI